MHVGSASLERAPRVPAPSPPTVLTLLVTYYPATPVILAAPAGRPLDYRAVLWVWDILYYRRRVRVLALAFEAHYTTNGY